MLLNAWGTIYKMAVKYLAYDKFSYELSPTEEMLSAKNIVADLWSILDHCCMILCYKYRGIPDPRTARKVHFPCEYQGQNSWDQNSWDNWEFKELELINPTLNMPLYLEKFQGVFSAVQYQGTSDPDILAFYQLYFLRNTLLHQSINIAAGNRDRHMPLILQYSHINRNAKAAITVNLPAQPWERYSTNKIPQPLIDVLYNACNMVQGRRDKLLGAIGEKTFGEKFGFTFTENGNKLEITFKLATPDPIRCKICRNQLHLECYGMEADLKDHLKMLRAHEYN